MAVELSVDNESSSQLAGCFPSQEYASTGMSMARRTCMRRVFVPISLIGSKRSTGALANTSRHLYSNIAKADLYYQVHDSAVSAN